MTGERVGAHFFRSSSRASAMAARKLLYVSGRFRALALLKGEGGGSAERRDLVAAAACLPDRRETEARGNASRRSTAATSSTLGPDFRGQARANSPSRPAFAHPSPA